MEKDNFQKFMSESKRKVYNTFFAKSFSDMGLEGGDFEQTKWQGKSSGNSLSFKKGELHRLFGYKEAQFKDLDRRIRTVHSSALLTLLFFKSVREDNSLKIDGVTYTKAFLETKNKCVEDGHPSTVDVMLVSEDEKTLLFLESKFTEYLQCGKLRGISDKYRMFYDSLDLFHGDGELEITDTYKDKYGKDVFDMQSSKGKPSHYCEGIKQMISHYIGLLLGPADTETTVYKTLFDKAENFILGEIVFDFCDDKEKFNDYKSLYESLAKSLERLKLPFGRKVQVRGTILT